VETNERAIEGRPHQLRSWQSSTLAKPITVIVNWTAGLKK
jgi:hypothetical protein